MATPPGREASVSGMIGFPTLSFTAEMFAAQSSVAMLMKRALFAMWRPTQILEV